MADNLTREIARQIRSTLAGHALTEPQAKLYSQQLRREMLQDGLRTFTQRDVIRLLDEALLLTECSLLERSDDSDDGWQEGLKRAAEILEWLSQASLRPSNTPLHFLAGAAYQVAGFPAMALGHLQRLPADESLSNLLRDFLGGRFAGALESTWIFWSERLQSKDTSTDLSTQTLLHVIMCVGTICAYLRTGDATQLERALAKLERLSSSLLHSRDPYSHLLAKLTAAAARKYAETCVWPQITSLKEMSTPGAAAALEQFARSAFLNNRSLVWPAQARGIQALKKGGSFVLCTPTGSGKTTVATLGIIQALFDVLPDSVTFGYGNLVLYLVPSRALAAEVESRLEQDLKDISSESIAVTGLYGGVDWGPTDAWIQTERSTIVVCTFEKCDALIRFLGVLFLHRVRLVVVDEAHMVEQNASSGLQDGTSRSLRLEQLGARILGARDQYQFRIIALSAVAAKAAPALARWLSGPDATPTNSNYRSTRQMLGRIEVTSQGQFSIRYDLMDGRSLKFRDERSEDGPYVPNPFPAMPAPLDEALGPEVQMRGPTLWAALQLAATRSDRSKPIVMISLTQSIETFSSTCADLLDSWPVEALPDFHDASDETDTWIRCLASARDYFTEKSVEYRLLKRGIAVHHGKMPALLARRLKILIDEKLVRVIIATSTLSEGVNIPVNYLLLPSIMRATRRLSVQEFSNLLGRAGRPGVATEGSALVVLPQRTMTKSKGRRYLKPSRQWDKYNELIKELSALGSESSESRKDDAASSPLAKLLIALQTSWTALSGSENIDEFMTWLESTAPVEIDDSTAMQHYYLDSLDAFLISAIQEVEELRQADIAPADVEAELVRIWRRTYAFAAHSEEARLASIWIARGRSIKSHYPDSAQRRQIYRTGLTPASAKKLSAVSEQLEQALKRGTDYARWGSAAQFAFVRDVLSLLSAVPSFRISTQLGQSKNFQNWPLPLQWWLARALAVQLPRPSEITSWFDFVATNFIYRGAWGIGSLIGLIFERTRETSPLRAIVMDDWPLSGLPWIAFWIKELLTWGTLDPVAAFLLARGKSNDRSGAEQQAVAYYSSRDSAVSSNDLLDPRAIRDWINSLSTQTSRPATLKAFPIPASLARRASEYSLLRLAVAPLTPQSSAKEVIWIDPAGYSVARSECPINWPSNPAEFMFELQVENSTVLATPYLSHRPSSS